MTQLMFLRCLSDTNWYFCRKINFVFCLSCIFSKMSHFRGFRSSGNNRKLGNEPKLGWFGLFSSLKSLNQTRLVFSLEIGKREATLRILKGPRWEDDDVSLNLHAAGRGKLIYLKIFKSSQVDMSVKPFQLNAWSLIGRWFLSDFIGSRSHWLTDW